MPENIAKIQKKINPILKKYQIKRASIFGSFARGEEKADSDIDILIELGSLGGLLLMSRLQSELEKILERKVDLLTYRSVNHLLAPYIKQSEISIYVKK